MTVIHRVVIHESVQHVTDPGHFDIFINQSLNSESKCSVIGVSQHSRKRNVQALLLQYWVLCWNLNHAGLKGIFCYVFCFYY